MFIISKIVKDSVLDNVKGEKNKAFFLCYSHDSN